MNVRKKFLAFVLTGCFVSACSAPKPAEPTAEVAPTFTLQELMQSMVGPRADSVWNAVAVSVTDKGIETKAPGNDDEWAKLRHDAVTMAEAMNSILVPGRKVAKPGVQPKDSEVELAPEQIEVLINQDRASWKKLAHDLQDAVMVAIKAIDAKDAEALSNAGTGIDAACETCHKKYWYPNDARASQK